MLVVQAYKMNPKHEQFSVESIEELDHSAQETALRELDASMSSQDLHIGLINADEFNDIQNSTIDWEDNSWCPDKETESASSLEEDETREVDSNSDNSEDEDYVPRICVRTGGSLTTQIYLNALPAISMEDSVYDSIDDTQDPTTTTDTLTETAKVRVEDDIIGHPLYIHPLCIMTVSTNWPNIWFCL
ncbi:hypothetical protein F7725_026963 [Dissostichus mawsoni]|uniref:Uncharacterized protein n=1 Tax=Dissostichus mawsoni TaxID=36200 RepID=A0A7J5XA45_DISMA|nr:hypothetical protein F7725_026963 [Dissostichus mawsoni]